MEIEHVAYNVADPVALAAWYGAHLGMKTVRKLDEAPFTHFLADSVGRAVLEVYHHTKAPVPDYKALDPLVVHIAFKTIDLASDMRRLLAAGATVAADVTVTPAGDEMVFLRDPWGLTIQLIRRARPLL
jgi:catechol 2,3-dioxygenase-like lactoylglutathione lyase family enzyme